jgi:cell surface protein SprA
LEDQVVGNSIANNGVWNVDGRINFETLYNKNKYLKEVNRRFSSNARTTSKMKKPKKFQRTYQLKDTILDVKHNLRNKKVKITATTLKGEPFPLKTKIVDENTLQILTTGKESIKLVVVEDLSKDKNIWKEIGDYSARLAMSVRNANVRWRRTTTSNIPQFMPEVGDMFGQSKNVAGIGFCFWFYG